MTIELVQECRSNEGYQPIEVKSSSDPHVHYLVLAASWLAPREYICECKSYQFRHRCKHQLEATKTFCRWTESEGPEQQTDEQRKLLQCPRCKGPTRRVMEEIDE